MAGVAGEWEIGSAVAAGGDRPQLVTGLTVTPGNASLQVSWDPVPGAAGYYVYSAATPSAPLTQRTSTADAWETRAMFSLPDGMPQWVVVQAYNAHNVYGDYSPEVTATAMSVAAGTPFVTLIPGNEAMGVDWPAVMGATSYRVYRRMPGFDWVLQAALMGSSFTDFDVQNGESVRYAVQAVNPNGPGAWAFAGPSLVNPALPAVPQNVRVQPGNGALQVEWSAVPTATGYYVYTASAQLGPYTNAVNPVGGLENRARVTAPNALATWVVVRAANAVGVGVGSVEMAGIASAALPATPSAGVMPGAMPGRADVTWGAVNGATQYYVWRRPGNGAPAQVAMTTMTSYGDMGLVNGSGYVYYVEAENAVGRGAWSGPLAVTAP